MCRSYGLYLMCTKSANVDTILMHSQFTISTGSYSFYFVSFALFFCSILLFFVGWSEIYDTIYHDEYSHLRHLLTPMNFDERDFELTGVPKISISISLSHSISLPPSFSLQDVAHSTKIIQMQIIYYFIFDIGRRISFGWKPKWVRRIAN